MKPTLIQSTKRCIKRTKQGFSWHRQSILENVTVFFDIYVHMVNMLFRIAYKQLA